MYTRIHRRWLLLLPLALAPTANCFAQKPDADHELTILTRRGRHGVHAADNVGEKSGSSPAISDYGGGTATGPSPTGLPPLPSAVQQPTLPQAFVDTTYPTVTGTSIAVHAGGDLQSALNAAQCGDEIVLEAGASFTGNFVVPAKACTASSQILVRSSQLSSLPAGARVQQSQASLMPTVQTNNPTAYQGMVLSITDGAAYWYFAGINFTAVAGITGVWNFIDMGDSTTDAANLPNHIVFDRVLIHGNEQQCKTGISGNAKNLAVINSSIWSFVMNRYDSQAILICNTPGPILISNNFLEATGENIMFGGCSGGGTTYNHFLPSDITVTRNHFHKRIAWKGTGWNGSGSYDVKNSFEIKSAQRVLLDSNVFDVTFSQGQNEFIILNCGLTVSGGGNPQVCYDTTITNNLFQHGNSLGVLSGNATTGSLQRVLYRNNLAHDITAPMYATANQVSFLTNVGTASHVTVDHNTVVGNGSWSVGFANDSHSSPYFTYTNNIANSSGQGFFMNGQTSYGTLGHLTADSNVSYNVLVGDWWPYTQWGSLYGGNAQPYPLALHLYEASSTTAPVSGQPQCNWMYAPATECWPLNWATVGFTDFAGGAAGINLAGFALAPTSPYYRAGSDAADIGANVAAVLTNTAGVVQ